MCSSEEENEILKSNKSYEKKVSIKLELLSPKIKSNQISSRVQKEHNLKCEIKSEINNTTTTNIVNSSSDDQNKDVILDENPQFWMVVTHEERELIQQRRREKTKDLRATISVSNPSTQSLVAKQNNNSVVSHSKVEICYNGFNFGRPHHGSLAVGENQLWQAAPRMFQLLDAEYSHFLLFLFHVGIFFLKTRFIFLNMI